MHPPLDSLTAERARAVILTSLHDIVLAASLAGELPGETVHTLSDGSLTVTVSIRRVDPDAPVDELTPCESDCLSVLADAAGRPLTKPRIEAALEARGVLYGDSTVRHTLAKLVSVGRVLSSRRSPRGYRLAV